MTCAHLEGRSLFLSRMCKPLSRFLLTLQILVSAELCVDDLCLGLQLVLVELRVDSLALQQTTVCTDLCDSPLFEDNYSVCIHHGRESVTDDDRGSLSRHSSHCFLNERFRLGINVR